MAALVPAQARGGKLGLYRSGTRIRHGGLVPAIHDFFAAGWQKDVDARDI
jgi:hypothetical protein